VKILKQNGIPDVHSSKPLIPIKLDAVGLRNYPVLLKVKGVGDSVETMIVKLDLSIDLPGDQRGVHISRLVDAVELFKDMVFENVFEYARLLAFKLLDLNNYSSIARVRLKYDIVLNDGNVIRVVFSSKTSRNDIVEEALELSFKGVIACPCLRELFAFIEGLNSDKAPTHMQRALLRIAITSRECIDLNPVEVYDVVKNSFSNTLTARLKRFDEYLYVKKLLSNPRFVEDVAREVLIRLYKGFKDKLRNCRIRVEVLSFESIHVYDIYASVEIDIDSLRGILGYMF